MSNRKNRGKIERAKQLINARAIYTALSESAPAWANLKALRAALFDAAATGLVIHMPPGTFRVGAIFDKHGAAVKP